MKKHLILLTIMLVLSAVLASCSIFDKTTEEDKEPPITHECVADAWDITTYPTEKTEGVKEQKCVECDKTLQTETIKASVGLKFKKVGETYTLQGRGECKDTSVVVPSTYDGLPVTAIESNAFKGDTVLVNILVGEHVNSIGDNAFYNCTSLKSIDLPKTLTKTGSSAFYNCSLLENVYFHGVLVDWLNIDHTNEHSNPTANNTNLYIDSELVVDLYIPDGEIQIKQYAFVGCNSIKSLSMADTVNTVYTGAFKRALALEKVVIGTSVLNIGDYAFNQCASLNDLTLGENVIEIGQYSYASCVSLVDLVIPNSVMTIKANAFDGCSILTNCTLGTSLTAIEKNAFYNCIALRTLNISNGMQTFGADAFYNCFTLEHVYYGGTADQWAMLNFTDAEANPIYLGAKFYIGGELLRDLVISEATKISNYAFYHCTTLDTVKITSATNVGAYAFYKCPVLETVIVDGENVNIGNAAFNSCYLLKNAEMKGVTTLGSTVFQNCSTLETVSLPDCVTINSEAFANCHYLRSVSFGSSLTTMYWLLFNSSTLFTTIDYAGTMEQWNAISKPNSGWSNYYNWTSGRVNVITIHCTDGDIRV